MRLNPQRHFLACSGILGAWLLRYRADATCFQ